jgi:uncharacterized protein (DUF2252 family)
MANLVKQILRYNAGRDPERLAMKYRNMRGDAFIFLRATCHLFYAALPSEAVLRKAPAAWACGDLHVENFGSYKGDNRLVYFDVNDFDEAVLAPATWDLVRLLSSVLVGRGSMQVSPAEALRLCDAVLDAYAGAMRLGKARWVERDTAPSPVSDLLEGLRLRHRPEFLDRRTEKKGRRRTIRVDGRKALACADARRLKVTALVDDFAASQPDPAFFRVLDVARRIAGNGSLGVDRYVVLVEGKGSPDANVLIDLKQALPSSLAGRVALPQPRWRDEADRVVEVQCRMQAVAMAFLNAVRMGSVPYVMRGLQPQEDRVDLVQVRHPIERLTNLMTVMGHCAAWSQLRSSGRQGSACADELIEFAAPTKWRKSILAVARECAAKVEADWKTYAKAYDDGAFAV